jgi:alanine-glyoxylate transaminase / serine-glyoxylate transaminase / serine-pyruvate transaminase
MFRRHKLLAGTVHRALEVWSEGGALSFNALVPDQRSVSVTTIRTAEGIDADRLRTHARETLAVSVAGGLGTLQKKVFRIGHLGDLNEAMVLGCLAALEVAFIELEIPHGSNGVRAAIEYLADQRAAAA